MRDREGSRRRGEGGGGRRLCACSRAGMRVPAARGDGAPPQIGFQLLTHRWAHLRDKDNYWLNERLYTATTSIILYILCIYTWMRQHIMSTLMRGCQLSRIWWSSFQTLMLMQGNSQQIYIIPLYA